MPKTGSSAIQQAFHGYEDRDVVYAALGGPNHQSKIKNNFKKTPEKLPFFRRHSFDEKQVRKRIKASRKLLKKSLRTRKSVIYSGESIADHLDPSEMAEMFVFFQKRFARVVVIAYVRPLTTLVSSQFQQRIRTGQREFVLPKPRYRRFFEPIVDNIAPENLHLVRFHPDDLFGGDVKQDFQQRVGAKGPLRTPGPVNKSLSTEAVAAIYAFNKYTGYLLPADKRVQMLAQMKRRFQGLGETRFGLTGGLVEQHLRDHADDVAWMEDKAGFDVKGEISTVPHPVGSEADLLIIADRFSALRAEDWRKQDEGRQ